MGLFSVVCEGTQSGFCERQGYTPFEYTRMPAANCHAGCDGLWRRLALFWSNDLGNAFALQAWCDDQCLTVPACAPTHHTAPYNQIFFISFVSSFSSKIFSVFDEGLWRRSSYDLLMFGCVDGRWYCNNPSIISEITHMRLEVHHSSSFLVIYQRTGGNWGKCTPEPATLLSRWDACTQAES